MLLKNFPPRKCLLGCLAWVMSAVGLASPALAAGGDIIILREVQPRSATREPLIPDPNPHVVNPHVVNPKPNAIIDRALRGMVMPPELSDSDFAAVTGSYGLPQQGVSTPRELAVERHFKSKSDAGPLPSSPAAGYAGSGLGGVAGQINRSLQHGLRPLQ